MSQIVRDVLSNEIIVLNNKVTNLEQERDKLTTLLGRTETQIAEHQMKRGELERHIASIDAAANAPSGSAMQPGEIVLLKPGETVMTKTDKKATKAA